MASRRRIALAGVSARYPPLLSHPCVKGNTLQATGNLGPALRDGLLRAKYAVTVLTRTETTALPNDPLVTCALVSYDNPSSLQHALKGHYAVVSALPMTSSAAELALIDAALAVGVQRFVPSNFGGDMTNEQANSLPCFVGKVQVLERLRAVQDRLEWISMGTGPYLDWCLPYGLFFDAPNKKVTYYDGGDVEFSATNLAVVADALAKALEPTTWKQLMNRVVLVNNGVFTQKQLVGIAKQVLGADGWTETVVDTGDMEREARQAFAEGKPDLQAVTGCLIRAQMGDGYGGRHDRDSNEALGVQQIAEAELREMVRGYCEAYKA